MSVAAALILFAHGSRDPEWAAPFHAIREAIRAAAPDARVELAFLEIMQPSLSEAIEALRGEGVREIVVVPAFMAQGGHLKRDLPELIRREQVRYKDCVIRQAKAIGEAPAVIGAIARYALDAAGA